MRNLYSNIQPISKLGVIALVSILSLIVFMIVAAVAAVPIFGREVFVNLLNSTLQFDESNVAVLKFFQLAQSVGLFIVPALIVAWLFSQNSGEYLMTRKRPFAVSAILAVLVVLAANPLINVIGLWNMEMTFPSWLSGVESWMKEKEDSAKELTDLFVNTDNTQGLLYNIFLIGLIPAIGEELLFRGVIQRIFTDWVKNKHVAIWITAIIFSAMHLQFYGFLPRAVLGAMFGYLLIWSGNLWLPVIAHFVNNTAAVIAYYLYNNNMMEINPDEIGVNSMYGVAGVISLVVVVFLFRIYFNYEKQKLKV